MISYICKRCLCSFTASWSRIKVVLIVLAFMAAIVAIILYSIDLYKHGRKKHIVGWASSFGFVLLTIPISLKLIFDHFTHWVQPKIQKYVVRIIWMVPLYSIESWMALRFKAWALHFETIRECYEAYVIFSFLYYLIALLGEESNLISILKEKPEDLGHHKFPVNLCMSPWIMGHELLHKCKVGVLQYVVIKNLLAVTIFILVSLNLYDEGAFRFDRGYFYVCIISNISQLWALYALILFYIVTKDELLPYRPLGKFLCVKGVVFFTFFQSILINVAASLTRNIREIQGGEDNKDSWTESEIAKGLQDYLICIEMFIFAIAFNFAFTHKDYIGNRFRELHQEEERKPFFLAFLQSSVPDEMFSDIRRVAKGDQLAQGSGTPMARIYNKSKDSMEENDEERLHGESSPFMNNTNSDMNNVIMSPSSQQQQHTPIKNGYDE